MAKLPGYQIPGTEYVVPALSLRQIRQLSESGDMDALGKPGADESALRVVYTALTRNHPELTVEQASDILDLANLGPALMAAVGKPPKDPPTP